jgi:hypothetical protein
MSKNERTQLILTPLALSCHDAAKIGRKAKHIVDYFATRAIVMCIEKLI